MSIDDNPIDRMIVERFIIKADFAKKVITCDSAESALAYLETHSNNDEEIPSVIFLDINMPDMNGFEFLDAYASLSKGAKDDTKIVMLTSSMDLEDFRKAKSSPYVYAYLRKPLTIAQLKEFATLSI